MKCIVCGKEEPRMWFDPVPAKKYRHLAKEGETHWLCEKHYRKRFHELVDIGLYTEEAFNLIIENAKNGLVGFKSYTGIEYNENKEAWDIKEEKGES